MFRNCEELFDLDLSSFDTRSVTNMDNMFLSCKKMGKTIDGVHGILDLSNFTIGSTTSINDMCKLLADGRSSGFYCPIVCSSDVENSMSSSATNINLSKVRFYRTRGAVDSK